MGEFFNVLPPNQARELLFQHIATNTTSELIATTAALDRITSEDIHAPHPLPTFRRSTMDGYAVRSSDTFGATASLPAFLNSVGEVLMGQAAGITLAADEVAIIHTGGMLPDDADAVVQIEHTHRLGAGESDERFEIEVFVPAAPGQNVIQVGEDIGENELILPRGKSIQPQDIGALLALGITEVRTARQPRIAIMATGDEIIDPNEPMTLGKIRDLNSYTAAALCKRAGAVPEIIGIIADDYDLLKQEAEAALRTSDMLVISAGSSVSVRDVTADILGELGEPGILVHGIATKPGKPTILGAADGKPLLGLPGNPVSAMVQFLMFGVPAIYYLQGALTSHARSIWVTLDQNIASETGREDYIPAAVTKTSDQIMARPIFGKSNLIFTLVAADGLIRIPLNKGGLLAGEMAELLLL